MSWSVSTPDACYVPDALEDIDKLEIPAGQAPDGPSQQVTEQLDAAKAAAKSLIQSGAVGPTGSDSETGVRFRTSLAGHANPNHLPAKGWANDAITVSITQVSE